MMTPANLAATVAFRERLMRMLREAVIHAGKAEPRDGCKSLEQLDELLGQLETEVQDAIWPPEESKRCRDEAEARTRARIRGLGLDQLLMQTDEQNGRLAALIGHRAPPAILAGTMRIALRKFLYLMERCPDEAFAHADDPIADRDFEVVIAAMRAWRAGR